MVVFRFVPRSWGRSTESVWGGLARRRRASALKVVVESLGRDRFRTHPFVGRRAERSWFLDDCRDFHERGPSGGIDGDLSVDACGGRGVESEIYGPTILFRHQRCWEGGDLSLIHI